MTKFEQASEVFKTKSKCHTEWILCETSELKCTYFKDLEYSKIVESKFQFLLDELEIRIESMRLNIENVALDMNKTVDKIKNKRKK